MLPMYPISLFVDLCDEEFCERLPVPGLLPVMLLCSVLKDEQLGPLGVLQDLCLNHHRLQVGLAHCEDPFIL